jgi:broad specificity phosphatase PhoE
MYDSETESEPEDDLKKWDATEFASQLPRTMSESSDRDLAERVTDAIATLESIPVEEVLMVSCRAIAPIVGSDWILGCRTKSFIGRLKVQPTRSSYF